MLLRIFIMLCLVVVGCDNLRSPTKSFWLNKAKQNSITYPSDDYFILAKTSKVVSVMGKPDKITSSEGRVHWYYQCCDGTIELVLDETALYQFGNVYGNIKEN